MMTAFVQEQQRGRLLVVADSATKTPAEPISRTVAPPTRAVVSAGANMAPLDLVRSGHVESRMLG